jgi:hypothetical protein
MKDNMQITKRKDCDILIVGGTLEGCIAAALAGRSGAEVILIENSGSVGAMATNGLHSWFPEFASGTAGDRTAEMRKEMLERLKKPCTEGAVLYNDQHMKIVLAKLLRDEGVTLLTHVYVSSPIMEEGMLKGFYAYGKTGCMELHAKRIIDATERLECLGALGIPQTLRPGRVQVGMKLNAINMEAAVGTCEKVLSLDDRQMIGMLKLQHCGTVGGLSLEADELLLLGNVKRREMIVQGLKCRVATIDPLLLSKAQMALHRYAYVLRDELRSRVPGFQEAHIIHVAQRMDTYGLASYKQADLPYENLLLCNRDTAAYDNNKALQIGTATAEGL